MVEEACLRSGSGPPGTRERVVDDCRLVEFCPGGAHEDGHKSRPLVLTYVRPGGPADR